MKLVNPTGLGLKVNSQTRSLPEVTEGEDDWKKTFTV